MNEVQERQMPTWEQVRERMNQAVTEDGEWAGCPLPIGHLKLTVEPKYPFQGLNGFSFDDAEKKDGDDPGVKVRNHWHDRKSGMEVFLVEIDGGRVEKVFMPERTPSNRWLFQINTLGVAASPAWSVEAECRAMEKLRELVTEHAFKCYFLSGMFLETSKRSNVTYCFRRSRPTIALVNNNGNMKPLCAMCLHPIGYYQESFAGVMVPTDCVVAHLMLCRGDEHRFWKYCNQHPIEIPNSGI